VNALLAVGGYDLTRAVLLKGVLTGLTYALLAIGLVLVYRSSRFINFAQIGVGLLGSSVLALLATGEGAPFAVPYWVAMVAAMAVGATVSVATEIIVVRPLRGAPKVLAMVATLGMASFFFFAALSVNSNGLQPAAFPQPTFFPRFRVDALEVATYETAQLILSPLLLLGLGLFLWRSRYGVAIRGAASNPDAASLAGVSPERMSVLSWGLAGALAVFSAALLIPSKGAVTPESIGPDLLLRALAAAAIVRFRSISGALGIAIAIGVTEQVLATNPDANGYIEVVVFAAVLVSLLATRRQAREEPEAWDGLSVSARLPVAYRAIWTLRWGAVAAGLVCLAGAATVPLFASNSFSFSATQVVALATVGVSVGVITGLGGQLSLGQFAIGGIGAAVAVWIAEQAGNFWVGLVGAAVAAGVVSALIGIPALRVRGLLLGVATLSFSLMCAGFLFKRDWVFGTGATTSRPGINLVDGAARNFYWVALAVLTLTLVVARNLRRGAFGRKLVAVRDNAEAARALSVPATRVRIQAYVVAGALAGLGGAIYASSFDTIGAEQFPVQLSVDAVIVTVIGGIGSLVGPVLGSAYLIGIPEFFSVTDNKALAALSAIWLILLTYERNGIAGLVGKVGRRVEDFLARLHGIDPVAARAAAEAPGEDLLATSSSLLTHGPAGHHHPPAPMVPTPLLSVRGLTRRFGGLVAVDDVSFDVYHGETLGLIGPNGAGKTTLFELVSGFVKPDGGTVHFDGRNVTALPPEQRSRLGMVRSFQSATLFPTLSLLDTVMVAMERSRPSTVWESLVGSGRAEHIREHTARDLIDLFGLTTYVDTPVGVLPTGTRRLVELACTVALQPRLILLDEPSAGIAQAETQQLSEVLAAIRDNYGVTFVVIEHDMPLLSAICDRMIALEVGRVIASGTPSEVQNHPAVVESYLGTNAVAVARSGAAPVLD
jgi:ABC-type branched-subunit amino acid transport system ATPase component/ABC-type branched-subunit amino acid transport system permease subunit